jgi:hypothetical protein
VLASTSSPILAGISLKGDISIGCAGVEVWWHISISLLYNRCNVGKYVLVHFAGLALKNDISIHYAGVDVWWHIDIVCVGVDIISCSRVDMWRFCDGVDGVVCVGVDVWWCICIVGVGIDGI